MTKTGSNAQRTAREFSRRDVARSMLGLSVAFASLGSGILMPAHAQQAETPKKGGRVRVTVTTGGPTDTFDPVKAANAADGFRICQVFNTLTNLDEKLQPIPELATSWAPNRDATEWTFKLREGVEFHSGKSLKGEDVVYSYNRIRDPQSTSVAKIYLAELVDVVADDQRTVRFRFRTPYVDFPILASLYNFAITPNGFTDFDKPVGTGPFQIKEFSPGIKTVTSRSPMYWKSDRGHVDEIEMFLMADQTARTSALLSDDVQIIQAVDTKTYDFLRKSGKVNLVESKSGLHTMLAMMCDREPFNDVNLRSAIKYGMDRQKILDVVLRGRGQIGNDHPIAPSDPFYDADLPVRPYDVDKAKFYLRKAGKSSLTVTLNTQQDGRGGLEAALLIKDMVAPAGIIVDVQQEPTDGYYTRIWKNRPFYSSTWNPRPTADLMLSMVYASTAESNDTQWKRPDFDKLLIEARGTLDFQKRKEMYATLQRMIHDDCGAAIHTFINSIDATVKRVKGMVPHPGGPLSNYRFSEQIWIDT